MFTKCKQKYDLAKFKQDVKKLDNWLFSRYMFIILLLFLLSFLLLPLFVRLTELYLVRESPFTSNYLGFGVFILSFFIWGFIAYKLLYLKYTLSFNQIVSLVVILNMYWSIRINIDATYQTFSTSFLSRFAYLDFIFLPISFFLVIGLFRIGKNWIKKYLIVQEERKGYFEDSPLSYNFKNSGQTTEIVDLICRSKFKGSFSIGIMGTWGYGKSSFINGIKDKLKSEKGYKDVIEINFSPYLNHKEDDIVSEFFTSFSSQLGRYSGSLSKSMMDYASSISKLYKRGEKVSFIDDYRFTNEKPAYELYEKINQQISDIGKKIVVFVDDLDRLNTREILEVFKLVRNTSNFNNTLFIIALDKTYIINSLNEKSRSLEVKFIDKFFQLEVFLPEISKKELSDYLLEKLNESDKIDEESIDLIRVAINKLESLFHRYIKNYRDCIRLANQIIFDHLIMDKLIREIDTNDFLNVIFLKSRFPAVFTDLVQNREKYLVHREKAFSLARKNDGKVEEKVIKMLIGGRPNLDHSIFEINDLFKEDLEGKKIITEDLGLLLDTLISIFGKEKNQMYKSVMKEEHFHKIMKLSYSENDLRDGEFNDLMQLTFDEMEYQLDILLKSGKGGQLLDRIPFHTISDKENLKSLIRLHFYFLKIADKFQLDRIKIKEYVFSSLSKELTKSLSGQNIELALNEKKSLVKEFFSDKSVDLKDRVDVLMELESSLRQTDFPELDKWELETLAINFLDEYFEMYKEPWEIIDYTFYKFFHKLKTLVNYEDINRLTINYLQSIDISVFCFQLIDQDPFTPHLYKVSDFIKELFGSYMNFKDFIDTHQQRDKKEMLEFRKFYELYLIVALTKQPIKFRFNDSNLLERKISNHSFTEKDIRLGETIIQIFVRVDNIHKSSRPTFKERYDSFFPVYNLNYKAQNYILFILRDTEEPSAFLDYIFDSYMDYFKTEGINATLIKDEKYCIIDDNERLLIEQYSIQK